MCIRTNIHIMPQNCNAVWTKIMLHHCKYRLQDFGNVG
jgi:hypothetical protein